MSEPDLESDIAFVRKLPARMLCKDEFYRQARYISLLDKPEAKELLKRLVQRKLARKAGAFVQFEDVVENGR